MTDVLVSTRRPAAPLRSAGRALRTVEGVDLSDMAEQVKHAYGVSGLAVHAHWVHYPFKVLGSFDAPVGTSTAHPVIFQYQAHPAARSVIVGVIAQSSSTNDASMELTVEMYEASDPAAGPVALDGGVGIRFRPGIDIPRRGIDGDPPFRFAITPRVPGDSAPTDEPTRMMSYVAAWPLGYPARIEVRAIGVGIRPHAFFIIESPDSIIEGA